MITKCLSPLFVRQLYIQGFLSFPHILKLCIINKGVFIYLVFLCTHAGCLRCCGIRKMSQNNTMNVFDRTAKKRQRNVTALAGDYHVFNYLKDEVF